MPPCVQRHHFDRTKFALHRTCRFPQIASMVEDAKRKLEEKKRLLEAGLTGTAAGAGPGRPPAPAAASAPGSTAAPAKPPATTGGATGSLSDAVAAARAAAAAKLAELQAKLSATMASGGAAAIAMVRSPAAAAARPPSSSAPATAAMAEEDSEGAKAARPAAPKPMAVYLDAQGRPVDAEGRLISIAPRDGVTTLKARGGTILGASHWQYSNAVARFCEGARGAQVNLRQAEKKAKSAKHAPEPAPVQPTITLGPEGKVNPYLSAAAEPAPAPSKSRDRSKAFAFIERGAFERRAAELRAKVRHAHTRTRDGTGMVLSLAARLHHWGRFSCPIGSAGATPEGD